MAGYRPASFEHLLESERSGRSYLKLAVFAAAAIHIAVFAVTWPNLAQTEEVEADRITVRRFPIVQFRKPPPPDQRFEVPPRAVPIPDPDPQGPEPIREPKPEIYREPPADDFVPAVPDPPPIVEPTDSETVFTVGIDIQPPKVIHRVEPLYPEAAQRIRFEGEVILSLLIDKNGTVSEVAVLRSLPFGLTESAVNATRQWIFEPSTYNGDPVSVRYILTIRFRIASPGA